MVLVGIVGCGADCWYLEVNLILLGAYTNVMSQRGWDAAANLQQLKEAGLDGISFHALTPHSKGNRELDKVYFPWPYTAAKKFDMSDLNDEWCEKFDEICNIASKARLWVKVKLFDQYSHYLMGNPHPFRNNNINYNLIPKRLYESWDRQGADATDFTWLRWFYSDLVPTSQYELRNLGLGIKLYLDFIAKTFKKYKTLRPVKSRFGYAIFNEEFVALTASGDATEIMGGETKIKKWVKEQVFQAAGLKFNNKFREFEDFINWKDSEHSFLFDQNGNSNLHESRMLSNHKHITRNRWHEVHSIESTKEVQYFINKGYDIARMMLTRDGTLDGQQNVQAIIELLESLDNGYNFETKLSVPKALESQYWDPNDMNKSFERTMGYVDKELSL